MSTDGVVAIQITKGTVDGEKIADFIQGKLIPEMLPFNGENCRSIVVIVQFITSVVEFIT